MAIRKTAVPRLSAKTSKGPRSVARGRATRPPPTEKASPSAPKKRRPRTAIQRRSTPRQAPARPTIFISYRHAPPTTAIANRLFTALVPAAEAWNADVFMDTNLAPSDLYDAEILSALDRTTHFIVLLNNEYWSSAYCRKEVARIVERFERDRGVLLLFVKVEELDPKHFIFSKDRSAGRIRSDNPLIERIGDVQFLGPFDESGRLVRLCWENEAKLGDQLAQLVNRLERVIG